MARTWRNLPRDAAYLSWLLGVARFMRRARKEDLTVPKMFDRTCRKYPDKVIIRLRFHVPSTFTAMNRQVMLVEVDGGAEWTFGQVDARSNRVAHLFLLRGLRRGDSVAVAMSNSAEFVSIQLGLAKAGVIPALVGDRLAGRSLEHAIRVAGSWRMQ